MFEENEPTSYIFNEDGDMIPCQEEHITTTEISYFEHLTIQAARKLNELGRAIGQLFE